MSADVIAFTGRRVVPKERRKDTWKLACAVLEPVHDLWHDANVTESRLARADEILNRARADLAKV
jgi:hypothetical protein